MGQLAAQGTVGSMLPPGTGHSSRTSLAVDPTAAAVHPTAQDTAVGLKCCPTAAGFAAETTAAEPAVAEEAALVAVPVPSRRVAELAAASAGRHSTVAVPLAVEPTAAAVEAEVGTAVADHQSTPSPLLCCLYLKSAAATKKAKIVMHFAR